MLNKDPQTAKKMKLVATHCALCSLPLCDAKSVEIGIGPVCRAKHGYGYCDELSEVQRIEANGLIYQIAINQTGADVVTACERLFDLGFTKLVARIMQRIARVVLVVDGGRLVVKSPYNPEAVAELRRIPGRSWDGEQKTNSFPAERKRGVYEVLVRHYSGLVAVGPKGPFVIGELHE